MAHDGPLSEAAIAIGCGPARPRGIVWNGAVRRDDLPPEERLTLLTRLIFPQARQVNFPRPILTRGGLDHLPRARDDLQGFCNVLAHLHDAVRPAARTDARRLDHHPLARQMPGEGFAHGPAACARLHRGIRFSGGLFGRRRVPGCRRLRVLKLQFRLIDQASPAFSEEMPYLSRRNLAICGFNSRIIASAHEAKARACTSSRSAACARGRFCGQRGAQSGNVKGGVRQGARLPHTPRKAGRYRRPMLDYPAFAGRFRPAWVAPVHALRKVAKLRCRDRNSGPVLADRPDEPAPPQAA